METGYAYDAQDGEIQAIITGPTQDAVVDYFSSNYDQDVYGLTFGGTHGLRETTDTEHVQL